MNLIVRFVLYIWAFPNSVLGVTFGLVGLLTGGKCQLKRGVLEFYGGFVLWALKRMPGNGVSAMTLGHTIVGQTSDDLAVARDHEHAHVRQYERWGPFFLPAYLGISAILWLQKKDCYMENPFEKDAYEISDPRKVRLERTKRQPDSE